MDFTFQSGTKIENAFQILLFPSWKVLFVGESRLEEVENSASDSG
jgi:hypothetical protein